MKIDLEQIKDCDHCWNTVGSFGCCDTVNNEWVYFCVEGQKKYLLDRVLEIIDAHLQSTHNRLNTFESPFVDEWIRCKKEVKALKGGEV